MHVAQPVSTDCSHRLSTIFEKSIYKFIYAAKVLQTLPVSSPGKLFLLCSAICSPPVDGQRCLGESRLHTRHEQVGTRWRNTCSCQRAWVQGVGPAGRHRGWDDSGLTGLPRTRRRATPGPAHSAGLDGSSDSCFQPCLPTSPESGFRRLRMSSAGPSAVA